MPIIPDMRAALGELGRQPTWQLADGELVATTEDLYRLVAAVNAEALRRLAEIDARGLAPEAGAPHTAAWLSARVQMGHGQARRQVKLAHALRAHGPTLQALAAGQVSVENAVVITTALDTLPATVDPAVLAEAEQTLIGEAGRFTPTRLTRIGQVLHAALDPDGPQPDDTEAPDPGYFLNLRTRTAGSAEGEFHLDPATTTHLFAMIDAGSAPRASTQLQGPDLRTAGRRRADALADIVHLAAAQTHDPVLGTGRDTIMVTVTLADLRAGLPGLGRDGAVIPAGQLRRMACDAHIIPAVLGTRSEVLDIGRRSRTIRPALYRALALRDKGCAFPGCERPPGWTHAHHIQHWAHGGSTALHNLVLLCRHHHDTIHQ